MTQISLIPPIDRHRHPKSETPGIAHSLIINILGYGKQRKKGKIGFAGLAATYSPTP